MATILKNLSSYDPNNMPDATGNRFSLVVSEYNADITFQLRDGCLKTLTNHGVKAEDISIYYVPGAFELPSGAQLVNEKINPNAIICLGCVIKGETQHDEYINHAIAKGITELSLQIKKPVIFGVLTPNTHQQAEDRAGGKHGNKGVEAAIAAIKMVKLVED